MLQEVIIVKKSKENTEFSFVAYNGNRREYEVISSLKVDKPTFEEEYLERNGFFSRYDGGLYTMKLRKEDLDKIKINVDIDNFDVYVYVDKRR